MVPGKNAKKDKALEKLALAGSALMDGQEDLLNRAQCAQDLGRKFVPKITSVPDFVPRPRAGNTVDPGEDQSCCRVDLPVLAGQPKGWAGQWGEKPH